MAHRCQVRRLVSGGRTTEGLGNWRCHPVPATLSLGGYSLTPLRVLGWHGIMVLVLKSVKWCHLSFFLYHLPPFDYWVISKIR